MTFVHAPKIRRDRGQRLHQRPLDLKALERFLARRTVDATAGLLQNPVARLVVEIGEVAEGADRQEVAEHGHSI